jgi:hypothetical protein
LPTSSPKTQPKFQSPIIIVGQYLIHIQNPLVLNYGVRSINYLKRRLFPSRCLGCGQGICPCHQATAIAALALLTSSIQIAFPLRHLHHRHPVNRLPRSTSASAFGATTPPSTAHPTPCLFLYDAAEEGFQGLRHGEVPRRLELARGQHGGWGGPRSPVPISSSRHGRWWRLGQLRRCGVCACGLPAQQLGEGACTVGRRLLLVVRRARVVLFHLFCLFPVRKSTAISPAICSIFLLRNVVTSILACVVLLALTDLLLSFLPCLFCSRFVSGAWDRVF